MPIVGVLLHDPLRAHKLIVIATEATDFHVQGLALVLVLALAFALVFLLLCILRERIVLTLHIIPTPDGLLGLERLHRAGIPTNKAIIAPQLNLLQSLLTLRRRQFHSAQSVIRIDTTGLVDGKQWRPPRALSSCRPSAYYPRAVARRSCVIRRGMQMKC